MLGKGADKIEGEISFYQDEITLFPKTFNDMDHDTYVSRNVDQVSKTGSGMDAAILETVFEKAKLKIGEGAKTLTGIDEPLLKTGQQPYYNGLGTLTKR